nr:GNAT family N-acetyltransferase [uncultured Cellulosilyticum sp.]
MYSISAAKIENAKKYISDASSIYFINILNGEADGIIWADQKVNPRLLMIWSEYQKGFQLMGKALSQNEWPNFYKWYEDVIIPFLKRKEIQEFECGADHAALAEMLQGVFANQAIKCEKQKIFYHNGEQVSIKEPIGYKYERVDSKFLSKDYLNRSYITDEIELAYGSYAHYLRKGYGYAAIKDNEVVARAIMSFSFNQQDNISVDTLEKHRRKGLSAYLVSKTIEETIRLNHTPIWDCNEYNIASEKTAQKCGFQMIREDDIYWFGIK